MGDIKLGGQTVAVEQFTGRKAIWAMRILRDLAKGAPEVADQLGEFVRKYEEQHVTVLDRTQAKFQFPPRTVYGEEAELIGVPDGTTIPSRIAHLSDEDWSHADNQLRLPRSPGLGEQIAHVFPVAFDHAEKEVVRLLALVLMPSGELGLAAKVGKDEVCKQLDTRGDDLLDHPADDLLELAVTAAEVIEEQFSDKIDALKSGDRLGKLLGLFGLRQEKSTPATETPDQAESPQPPDPDQAEILTSSRSTSSTDSPTPSDGTSERLSTLPVGVSSVASEND